jgi:hypothetical protein
LKTERASFTAPPNAVMAHAINATLSFPKIPSAGDLASDFPCSAGNNSLLAPEKSQVEAENLLLRHQIAIALRQAPPPRLRLRAGNRALLIWMTRLWPSLLDAVQVVQPETVLRWHSAGFQMFWRWKSRHRAGRSRINRGLRDLIRRISRETGAHPGFMPSF